MWDLPIPGLEPVSPALAGRFSTTAPPGKPHEHFFEASRHIEEIAAALDTASTQEALGWDDLSYQNLEGYFPRGRTKGEWGSHRLGVTWERAQHVSPLCTNCGTPLSCREAETIQNPVTRGCCEGCGRKCKGTCPTRCLENVCGISNHGKSTLYATPHSPQLRIVRYIVRENSKRD